MIKNLIIAIALLLFSQCVLSEDVYRTVDENGRVQYSQFPSNKDDEKITIKGARSNVPSGNANSAIKHVVPGDTQRERQDKFNEYLQSEREERTQLRNEKKQKKAAQKVTCDKARTELHELSQGDQQYYEDDENGNRVYIDDSRIEERKRHIQKYIDGQC